MKLLYLQLILGPLVQFDVGNSKLEIWRGPVRQGCHTSNRRILGALFEEVAGVASVVSCVKVCKKDYHDVAGKADEYVPNAMKERHAHVPPDVAEEL